MKRTERFIRKGAERFLFARGSICCVQIRPRSRSSRGGDELSLARRSEV